MRGSAISFFTLAHVTSSIFVLDFLCRISHSCRRERSGAFPFCTVANIRPELSSDSLHNINNEANNHQTSDQSVSEHDCLPVCDQRLSMECRGQGNFQDVKLQRPTPATACSHPANGMATTLHQIQAHHDGIQNQRLCCCEHLRMAFFSIVKRREITRNFRRVRWSAALISNERRNSLEEQRIFEDRGAALCRAASLPVTRVRIRPAAICDARSGTLPRMLFGHRRP